MKKHLHNLFCSGFLFTCFALSAVCSFAQTNVITQHNNLKRTGWNNTETQLTQSNVGSGNFGKIFTRQVDDQIYAQPLVVSNVSISGGTHNVVYIATVNNTLYAFDADDSSVNTPYWQQNLTYNPPAYRPINNNDMAAAGACGGTYKDISGNMGIIGTPVIDTATNTLYIVARSISTTGSTYVQYLHAIDITTGAEKPNSPVYITATYPGSGYGSSGGIITFNQQRQNQRPALLLYKGVVYISWASQCDWGPYNGWIIGYDASNLQQKFVYNDCPNGSLGGIWMSGQGPSVDDSGYIYVSTGNGTTGSGSDPNDTTNRGESLLKLSTTSGQLKVVDFFTPFDYNYLNDQDLDYGSDGVLLIPNTNLSLSGSKESYLYVINDSSMGGTTTDDSNVRQLLDVNASSTNSQKHLHGSPVYFKDAANNEYIYAWAEGGLLKQFPFNRSSMLFDTLNEILGNTTLPDGMPGAMLSLSSNGSQNGTGILWASHPINGNANQSVVPGILQAFDANDVSHELWNSNWSNKRDSIGRFAKFVAPTVANGKVYMATFSNVLNVYGLNPPAASPCISTLPAGWQSVDIGYTAYAGDVCYDNGVYTITASGDNIYGSVDAFHNLYQPAISSYLDVKARIVSIQNTDPSAKCGIMFRSNLDPGSPNVFMMMLQGYGASFQSRLSQGGSTTNIAKGGINLPYWIRVVTSGNKYTGYISQDGNTWTALDSVTVALGSYPYVGLAYTSHDNSILGTAVVDNFTVTTLGVLPVELKSFTAINVQNTYSQLQWSVSQQLNIDHFEVERSSNTTDYTSIGSVTANGNSTGNNDYKFNDVQPLNNENFYRLKEVDIDGKIKYSSVIKVSFNFDVLTIFPNPAHKELFVRNNNHFTGNDNLAIELTDLSGKMVYKQTSSTSGVNLITINIPPQITAGMYILSITNSKGKKQTRKVYISR